MRKILSFNKTPTSWGYLFSYLNIAVHYNGKRTVYRVVP